MNKQEKNRYFSAVEFKSLLDLDLRSVSDIKAFLNNEFYMNNHNQKKTSWEVVQMAEKCPNFFSISHLSYKLGDYLKMKWKLWAVI